MKFFARTGALTLLALLTMTSALAQDVECAVLVQRTLETARESCLEIGSGQACYGSGPLTVEAREDADITFRRPGDTVDLSAIDALTSGTLASSSATRGLAILNTRASLMDGGVTMLMVGDVRLENRSPQPADFIAAPVRVSWPQGANLRAEPDESAQQVGSLVTGQAVTGIGRTQDSTWLLVDTSAVAGWVKTELMRADFDLSRLRVAVPDALPEMPYLSAMQTLHLDAAIDDAPCAGAPDSGVLAQTPDGVFATLFVNDAALVFNGTIWLQSTETNETVLSVLEGEAQYPDAASGEIRRLRAGRRITFGYQGARIIFKVPEDYHWSRARYLPLVLLPREFELPFSLGGIIQPFTPGTGFISAIPADAECTVAWTGDVNLRQGPGTDYPIRQGVPGGFYSTADARAQGSNGALWWRLTDSVWIAADATVASTSCGTLSMIDMPPLPVRSG